MVRTFIPTFCPLLWMCCMVIRSTNWAGAVADWSRLTEHSCVPVSFPYICYQHVFESQKMQACEPRATGPVGPRKDSASIILESSAVLLVWILAPACARCTSVGTTRPNMTGSLPSVERATANRLQFHHQRSESLHR